MSENDPIYWEDSPAASIRRGWQMVRLAPRRTRVLLAGFLLLGLSMLPFGRTSPGVHHRGTDHPQATQPGRLGGGPWKILAADSDSEYLPFRHYIAIDYFCTYEAGWLVLNGRDPYLVNLTGTDQQPEDLPSRAPYSAKTYRYLPLTAVLLGVPLNILPPWSSYITWILINFVLLVLNFLLCVGRRPSLVLAQALVWFSWFPLAIEWYMGQFSFLMATLILWGVDGFATRRGWGPVCWTGSVLVKIYSAVMALPLWLWGFRRSVLAAAVLAGVTSAGYFALSPASLELFRERGLEGRFVGGLRQPYAPSQGVQEGITALVWAASGRSFAEPLPETVETGTWEDPTVWLNGLVLLAFGCALGWAIWRTRHGFSAAALGLCWLLWVYAYRDCWEHHIVLLQGLTAWWLLRGVLRPWQAVVAWIGIGAPSLWVLFEGNEDNVVIGLAYYWQRPLGILFLTWIGLRHLIRGDHDQVTE